MNNNICCDYIGATGIYSISDNIDIASNILNTKIDIRSNILNDKIDTTSNILKLYTDTNITNLDNKYKVLIKQETEDNLINTYITNSNIQGEIRFITKFNTNDYRYKTRIKENGEIEVYYPEFNILFPTMFQGWYSVMNSIRDAYNYQVVAGELIGGALLSINDIYQKYYGLVAATGASLSSITGGQLTKESFANIVLQASKVTKYNRYNQVQAILGITGIGAAGLAYSVLNGIRYDHITNNILYDLSNLDLAVYSNITQIEKDTALSNIINDTNLNIIETNTSLSNLNILQGFINSNIQTRQFITSLDTNYLFSSNISSLNLFTSNLYVNSGNINGVDINNLKTSGNIIENGLSLSSKYLTSNNLYNIIPTYSSERQYPSKLYTTTQTEDTATLLGKLVYRSILYLDNTGISYGSGFYEVFSSSTYDTNTAKNKLFNFDTAETTNTPRWGISLYNSGTGNYSGDNSIDNIYYGDWVILKMPQPMILTRYRIYQNTQFPNRAPSEWKVYGSNDGITFTQITEAHQLTRLLASDYTFYYYNKALATTFITSYQYIGFVFNKLVSTSGATTLDFAELQIFGKEIISNTIDSQIYTTSNAVKGIVEFEMPIVCKHKAFYCQTSSIIYPNNGNTAYYKYDIDMRNYTQTGYIQIGSQSNDPYRIFRIRAFLGSCYFSTIVNGLPNILHYEIYMSYKANAASGGQGAAGVNIFAVGVPNNPSLNIIPPNNIFILTNPFNDFNYITLVSTSPADIRVIIEDLIS